MQTIRWMLTRSLSMDVDAKAAFQLKPQTIIDLINPLIRFNNKNFFATRFGYLLTKLGVSRRFQSDTYIVFHEESESEVQNIKFLQENPQNFDFKLKKKICFNPINGLSHEFLLHGLFVPQSSVSFFWGWTVCGRFTAASLIWPVITIWVVFNRDSH